MLDVSEMDSLGFGGFKRETFCTGGISWFTTFLIDSFGLVLKDLNLRLDISTSNLKILLVFFLLSFSRAPFFISKSKIISFIFLKL